MLKKPPSKEWMMLVLSQIDQHHVIFTKRYVKPKKKRRDMYEEVSVNNPEGFFDQLVIPSNGQKKGRSYTGFIDKRTTQQTKLANMERKMLLFQERMEKQSRLVRELAVSEQSESSSDNEAPEEESKDNPLDSAHQIQISGRQNEHM